MMLITCAQARKWSPNICMLVIATVIKITIFTVATGHYCPVLLWPLFPLILTATIESGNHYCPVFIFEDTVVGKVKQFACSLTDR